MNIRSILSINNCASIQIMIILYKCSQHNGNTIESNYNNSSYLNHFEKINIKRMMTLYSSLALVVLAEYYTNIALLLLNTYS